jgi:hypothetical protein
MQILEVGYGVLVAAQTRKDQSDPSEVLHDVVTHVTLDVNQIIVNLSRSGQKKTR